MILGSEVVSSVQHMDRGCITNCPIRSNTSWDVLIIAVAAVGFIVLVAASAAVLNRRDDRHHGDHADCPSGS
jgi:signal transduction histidine kinase